ncbi:nucleotide-diphospho-sugar transferase [Spinellus fusiger]|nr:nucleotide-diphospho-sugar transferase [Spinellus fusiger]
MPKVLFLVAGYGTRLQRDLEASPSHRHLLGRPKALLPLGHSDALLTQWVDLFSSHTIPLSDMYLVTHHTAYPDFCAWALRHHLPLENILNNTTLSPEDRLGAVADIRAAIVHFQLQDTSLVVVGGDTLFLHDFSLRQFLAKEASLPKDSGGLVCLYTVPEENVSKVGICEINAQGILTQCVEKPSPHQTQSRLACPCFYLLRPLAIQHLLRYVEDHQESLEALDATGRFLGHVHSRCDISTFGISGRIDVGGLASYLEADAYMACLKQ